MPLPPWVNVQPTDFLRATEQGTQAGLANQAQQNQAAEASARLTQEQQIAQMQAQARQQIVKQNALRQQQQIEIGKAYKEAQVGLAQDRLQRQTALDQAKAQEQAKKFAAQQKFSQLIQSGMSPEKALYQVPELSTPSAVASMGRSVSGREYGDIQTKDLGGGNTAVYRSGSPGLHMMPNRQSIDDQIFKIQMGELAKQKAEAQSYAGAGNSARVERLQKAMDELKAKRGSTTSGTGTSGIGSKKDRANEIHKANPELSKRDIIDMVNKEFEAAPAQ